MDNGFILSFPLWICKAQWLLQWESPFKLRSRIKSKWWTQRMRMKSPKNTSTASLDTVFIDSNHPHSPKEDSMILLKEYESGSKLKVVRLGNVGAWSNDDEDIAWEGNEDPFVHLSADERQAKLKSMSIEEIKRAGMEYKKQKDKSKQKEMKTRPKPFKRPERL